MASCLFVHQNFPGQFLHLSRALAQAGHQVVAIGSQRRSGVRPTNFSGVKELAYPEPAGPGPDTHHYLRGLEGHVRRGQAVFRLAQELSKQGFRPDLVMAHPGWGEALFLRDAYPDARHVQYMEFFYRADGADVGFDPEFPATLDDRCRIRIKNATQMLSFEAADRGISPTRWQRSRYPLDWQERIACIHDGIDTDAVTPCTSARIMLKQAESGAIVLGRTDEVLTFVARNLEPYRGFHTFMRAVPAILATRPNVRILIVGADGVSYGRAPAGETHYRQIYSAEWPGDVDRTRVHFLGRLEYADYLRVLQISSLHVYLTYPFVLSWSLLEAMSSGCVVLGSDTPPVREVIDDGRNGFLTDFFDAEKLAQRVAELLASRCDLDHVRSAARQTVVDRYDLERECMPRLLDEALPSGKRSRQ